MRGARSAINRQEIGMKLCITMISNRPRMARERWLSSIHKLDPLREKIDTVFSFVLQEPFTEEDAVPYKALGATKLVKKSTAKRFNWWPNRNEVVKAHKADFYLMTDDDHRFGGPTPSGYTSWERYYDAIMYMEENPDCGAVCLLPFLGGTPSGKKILIAEKICLPWGVVYFCDASQTSTTATRFLIFRERWTKAALCSPGLNAATTQPRLLTHQRSVHRQRE